MSDIPVVTDDTFEELVLKATRPVVVDFWADWCGPCKMLAPHIDALAEKYGDSIDVLKMDVETNSTVPAALSISSIPVIAMFRPGQPPVGLLGFHTLAQLEARFGLEAAPADPAV